VIGICCTWCFTSSAVVAPWAYHCSCVWCSVQDKMFAYWMYWETCMHSTKQDMQCWGQCLNLERKWKLGDSAASFSWSERHSTVLCRLFSSQFHSTLKFLHLWQGEWLKQSLWWLYGHFLSVAVVTERFLVWWQCNYIPVLFPSV